MAADPGKEVLAKGEKVHIVFRRLFSGDVRRHFVGAVQAAFGDRIRVEGYAFVYNEGRNEFERKPELRTRVVSLSSALHLNVIAESTDLDAVTYREGATGLVATDGKDFALDINEFGPKA